MHEHTHNSSASLTPSWSYATSVAREKLDLGITGIIMKLLRFLLLPSLLTLRVGELEQDVVVV